MAVDGGRLRDPPAIGSHTRARPAAIGFNTVTFFGSRVGGPWPDPVNHPSNASNTIERQWDERGWTETTRAQVSMLRGRGKATSYQGALWIPRTRTAGLPIASKYFYVECKVASDDSTAQQAEDSSFDTHSKLCHGSKSAQCTQAGLVN